MFVCLQRLDDCRYKHPNAQLMSTGELVIVVLHTWQAMCRQIERRSTVRVQALKLES
jgi:hypothetical protein